MSIGMASLVFFIYMDKNMRKRSVLNDLLKTMKNIYMPNKGKKRDSDLRIEGSNYTMKIENIDDRTRHIHLKQKELSLPEQEEEKKFEKLLNDMNDVLFYLSNIEF